MNSRAVFAALVLVGLTILVAPSAASAQNYCTDANPNDNIEDNVALQQCLDGGGTILLTNGSPGYILRFGLRLRVDGIFFSSVSETNRAKLIAHADLNEFMINADANNWQISFLIFDGNRANRTNSCVYPRGNNIQANGDAFVIRFVNSDFARCGSALEVRGSNFEIYNNTMAFNGWSADERASEFADGMTIHRCVGGIVWANQFAENTDVGLVVNEGTGCTIRYNEIWNESRYAFAGFHVSASSASGGDHSGGNYSNNDIRAGQDLMGFGLIVGAESWHHDRRTLHVGSVGWNTISGAVINLAVDGVDGGTVTNNVTSNARGTRGYLFCNGQPADEFIAAHNGPGLTLQSGWVTRTCH